MALEGISMWVAEERRQLGNEQRHPPLGRPMSGRRMPASDTHGMGSRWPEPVQTEPAAGAAAVMKGGRP